MANLPPWLTEAPEKVDFINTAMAPASSPMPHSKVFAG